VSIVFVNLGIGPMKVSAFVLGGLLFPLVALQAVLTIVLLTNSVEDAIGNANEAIAGATNSLGAARHAAQGSELALQTAYLSMNLTRQSINVT
jgi:hypothetical protein